jgi:hypothetical protein
MDSYMSYLTASFESGGRKVLEARLRGEQIASVDEYRRQASEAHDRQTDVLTRLRIIAPWQVVEAAEARQLAKLRNRHRYYGSNDAASDLQLLWNASSSLAHGERWYAVLTSRPDRAEVAKILTARSFDGVCSGVNVTGLRLSWLAASPADS